MKFASEVASNELTANRWANAAAGRAAADACHGGTASAESDPNTGRPIL